MVDSFNLHRSLTAPRQRCCATPISLEAARRGNSSRSTSPPRACGSEASCSTPSVKGSRLARYWATRSSAHCTIGFRTAQSIRCTAPLVARKSNDPADLTEPVDQIAARNVVDGLALRTAFREKKVKAEMLGLDPAGATWKAVVQEMVALDETADAVADLTATLDAMAQGSVRRPRTGDRYCASSVARRSRIASPSCWEAVPPRSRPDGPSERRHAPSWSRWWMRGSVACLAIRERSSARWSSVPSTRQSAAPP